MKLPNGENAQLGDKLERYCLNPQHFKGKDKAALFANRLGITLENKHLLENALLAAAISEDAIIYKQDEYGTQYDIKFFMSTETEPKLVLSCWIIRAGETIPRLTNTYPVDR
jgi:hypothetical protein